MPPARMACLLLVLLSPFLLGFGPARLTDGDWTRRPLYRQQIMSLEDPPFPETTAVAVLVANVTTGRIMYARNEHAHRAPASLTKIVTAIVAMERGNPSRKIEMKRQDMAVYSMIGLDTTEVLTLHDLLYILLIPSDNAASMAIARTLGGDVRTFVGWMNAKVAEWGLQDTHFANPHGLDEENNYTSAYDMAIIALRAMQNPKFAEIVGLAEIDIANRRLRSTNEMLRDYPGAIGVKTGTEELAGDCLITLVRRAEGTYLSVVLGSTDRYMDSKRLLDYFYATNVEFRVDLLETDLNRYLDSTQQWHRLALARPAVYLVSPRLIGTEMFFRRIDTVSPDVTADQAIGQLMISLGGRALDSVPMYAR